MNDDGLEHNPRISRQALADLHEGAFGWALSLTAYDPQAAEDVMQQAYLALVEGKARFDGEASLKTWLFAVIRNSARRHARSRQLEARRIEAFSTELAEEPGEDEPRQDDAPTNALRQAIVGLPERQRQVLELVIDSEFTLQEAAHVMGITVGSARTHYHRAKQTLRRQLGEAEDG